MRNLRGGLSMRILRGGLLVINGRGLPMLSLRIPYQEREEGSNIKNRGGLPFLQYNVLPALRAAHDDAANIPISDAPRIHKALCKPPNLPQPIKPVWPEGRRRLDCLVGAVDALGAAEAVRGAWSLKGGSGPLGPWRP
jgi:hypothetical protein